MSHNRDLKDFFSLWTYDDRILIRNIKIKVESDSMKHYVLTLSVTVPLTQCPR